MVKVTNGAGGGDTGGRQMTARQRKIGRWCWTPSRSGRSQRRSVTLPDDIWTRFSSGFSCFLRLEAGLHQDLEVLEQVGTNLVDISLHNPSRNQSARYRGWWQGRQTVGTDRWDLFTHLLPNHGRIIFNQRNAGQGARLQSATWRKNHIDKIAWLHSHFKTADNIAIASLSFVSLFLPQVWTTLTGSSMFPTSHFIPLNRWHWPPESPLAS